MNGNKPFLLRPATKDYLWGGSRLKDDFGKKTDCSPLAETWECSTHPDGPSIVASGPNQGKLLSDVIKVVSDNKLSLDAAKKLLYEAIDKKIDPIDLIKKEGMEQINDESKLLELIKGIMDENPEVVRQYVEDGNMSAINFFVGQTMKKSNRQANPNMSREIISKELERRKNNG